MTRTREAIVVFVTFTIIAAAGIALSLSAPYVQDSDELTYLVGTLQATKGTLPDADMLKGYDTGPYLYPHVLARWYEPLGHNTFKSAYLFVLIVAMGSSVYVAARLLCLPWMLSLVYAIVALMPRYSAGLETLGALTFREAQGRAMAVPLFFIASALIVRRISSGRSLWPLFAIVGLCSFLHPVTVMLFACVALIGSAVALFARGAQFLRVAREVLFSGLAFLAGGAYFFIEVIRRLFSGSSGEAVDVDAYVRAVTERVAWEFPSATLAWFPHMFIVSALFVAVLVVWRTVPSLRALTERFPLPYGRDLYLWGSTVAISALVLCVALPGANLYVMEHFGAPYIFQQWSRIAKFFYFGLLFASMPATYALWMRGRERFNAVVVGISFLICGVASSSFAFELAQFVAGYPNYERAYIPQLLSGALSDTTPSEYRAVCDALKNAGITSAATVLSGDFALRYYCEANLFVTSEEGGALLQRPRTEVVSWHERLLAQREALNSDDPSTIVDFADSIGAEAIVLTSRNARANFDSLDRVQVIRTSTHTVVRLIAP